MSNTREILRDLGTRSSEDVLVEAGKKVLRDGIKEYLAEKGISDAVGFEIKLKNGEEFTILSEENPRSATPMDQVESINARQSAKGGLIDVLGGVESITLVF